MSTPPHDVDGSRPRDDDNRIRRIAKACTNCRRKKSKCSGGHPVCRNCLRLRQVCTYGRNSESQARTSQDESQNDSEEPENGPGSKYQDHLTRRITAIEGKLDDLISTIQRTLPVLQAAGSLRSPERTQPDPWTVAFDPCQDSNAGFPFQPAQAGIRPFTELPPMSVTLSLIDLYFLHVHCQPYSFFHEHNFRQRFADGFIPTYLTFAVIASALRFAKDDHYHQPNQQEAITAYSRSAWDHIVRVLFAAESDPNLEICQAVTLLSIIDFTAGRRHPGWMKIGLSIRLAQDLRLMLEPDSQLSCEDQEERRRVFWSIYVLDKLCSCGRARPAALLDSQCVVQLPGHDDDFRNGRWKKTLMLKQAFSITDGSSERPSSGALVVLVATVIGKCAQRMIHENGRMENVLSPWDSKSDFAIIHSMLLHLETQFQIGDSIEEALLGQSSPSSGRYDMQIAGPVFFFYALFYTAQCLLNHPFLLYQQSKIRGTKLPASFLNRALQSGRESAYSMSKLLLHAERIGCPIYFSFIGYCTTVCASIHTMYLHDQNAEFKLQAQQCLEIERRFLKKFSLIWNGGSGMLRIIERLASRPSLVLAVVTAAPQFELLDIEDKVDLWAAIDYTTMMQESAQPTSHTNMRYFSPTWDRMPDITMESNPPLVISPVPGTTTGSGSHDRTSPYNGMMEPGSSPFSVFLRDAHMNFGA